MAARERPTKYVYSIHIHNVIGNQSKNFPTVPMSKSDFFLQYTYIPQQDKTANIISMATIYMPKWNKHDSKCQHIPKSNIS